MAIPKGVRTDMSKRLTRKQIKEDIRHDELQTAVTSTVDSLASHRDLVIWGTVAVVAMAVAISVAVAWKRHSVEASSLALARAIDVYEAPIVEADAKPDDPKKPSFASEAERMTRAREAFSEVGSGLAADVASLYLAEMDLRDGDTESARAAWQAFLDDHSGHALAISMRRNLIRLDRDHGKGEQIVEELRTELESETRSLPEDLLLYELAVTLEALDRGEEAKTYYQRILDDYSSSSFAATARQKTST
jgi:TolA-binding protein